MNRFARFKTGRTLSLRTNDQRFRLAVLSVVVGVVLGLVNLAANWMIASADREIRRLLVERMSSLDPFGAIVTSPVFEEIVVRLFLMSAIAWIVFRFTQRATLAFVVALVSSSLIFASLHLARPFPGDPALATYYRMTLLVKYTLAGLPLGWIFWRWGLAYAILSHMTANAAHLVFQRWVF